MIAIPDETKIGPYTYKTEWHDEPFEDPDGPRGQLLYGQADATDGIIRVARCNRDREETIYLHEALHLLDEFLGLGLKEKQITRLAPGLLAFLRDNNLIRDADAA